MSKFSVNIDKKQMPQVIGLGVLSFGMIGYFSMRLLTPNAPAGTASAAATVGTRSLVHVDLKGAAVGAAPDGTVDLTNGAAPAPGMRDPFVPLVADSSDAPTGSAVKVASALTAPGALAPVPGLPPPSGSVQPLPAFGGGKAGSLAPLSATIAPPAWAVTGVLSGPDASTRVAVLRQGDVHRFVHLGAMVDEQYRLVGIDRSGVTLGVGKTHFRLPLGGSSMKTALHVPAVNAAAGVSGAPASLAAPAVTEAQAPVAAPGVVPAAAATSADLSPSAPAADATDEALLGAVAAGTGPQ